MKWNSAHDVPLLALSFRYLQIITYCNGTSTLQPVTCVQYSMIDSVIPVKQSRQDGTCTLLKSASEQINAFFLRTVITYVTLLYILGFFSS